MTTKNRKKISKKKRKSLRLEEFITLCNVSDSDPITLMVIEHKKYSENTCSAVRSLTVDSWREISRNFMASKVWRMELGFKSTYVMNTGVGLNDRKIQEPMYVIYIDKPPKFSIADRDKLKSSK